MPGQELRETRLKRQAGARSQRTSCAMLKICDFIPMLVGNRWGNSSTEVTCSDFLKKDHFWVSTKEILAEEKPGKKETS